MHLSIHSNPLRRGVALLSHHQGPKIGFFSTFFSAHLIPWIYTYLYPFFTLKVPKSSMARSVPPGEQDDCDDTESQKSTIGVNDKCEEPSDEDEESSSGDEPETGSGSQGKPSAEEMRKIWKKKKAMRQ